jgi:hypothetical protein
MYGTMGFHKRHLPELKPLKETLNRLGEDLFYKIYIESPDALSGPTESFDFIKEFEKHYEASKIIQEK